MSESSGSGFFSSLGSIGFVVALALFIIPGVVSKCGEDDTILPESESLAVLHEMYDIVQKDQDKCDAMATDLNAFWDGRFIAFKDQYLSMDNISRSTYQRVVKDIFEVPVHPDKDGIPESAPADQTAPDDQNENEVSLLYKSVHAISGEMSSLAAKRGFRVRSGSRSSSGARASRSASRASSKNGRGQNFRKDEYPNRSSTFIYIGGHRYERVSLSHEERQEYKSWIVNSGEEIKKLISSCIEDEGIQSFGNRMKADLVEPPPDPNPPKE